MTGSNKNTLFTEASLTSSVIYQSFNNNAEMTKNILSAIKDSIVIDSSYIEEQLMQIKRTRISPLLDDVLEAFNNGTIVLLYAKKKKIPQAIPFFALKTNNKIKVFIFTNNYGTITSDKKDTEKKFLNITMKDLYVLMEGAYVTYNYSAYPTKMIKNTGLMKISCSLYTSMLLRILNKEYAISMDQDVYNNVAFCIGKFFLKNIWGATNEDVIFSYACSNIKSAVNRADMMVISENYDSKNIESINQLLDFIKEFSQRLKPLNFRYFLQCYINTYKPNAMFSLECLPYFLYTIEAAMIGSFLVNQPIISDITKNTKGMNVFYPELVKALS